MNFKTYIQSANRGFTLVELMITLFIAAILLGLAIPNFSQLIKSNAIASQSNLFTTALNVARSEAIKRNVSVFICKRAGTACTTTGQWEDGWIVFADADSDKTLDAGEEVRVFDALTGNYTLRADSTLNWLSFQPNGKAQRDTGAFTGVVLRLCAADAVITESRAITLNAVGRASLSKGTTSCP